MNYRLKKDEPLASGIRRIAREQLEKAEQEILGLADEDEGGAVLAMRKHIKRTRALLRLARDPLGSKIFKGEDRRLRDVARGFSGSRDARALLQSLEKLRESAAPKKETFAGTCATLKNEIATAAKTVGNQPQQAAATLQQVCDRLEGWPLENLTNENLSAALKKTYRRGRTCFCLVESNRRTEKFHAWRKRVKDLCYQAQILQNLNQTVLCEMAEGAKNLGRHLGELHDLAFFRQRLETGAKFPEDERALLLGLICARECELEQVALDLGARFYAEKPGAFARRLLDHARD